MNARHKALFASIVISISLMLVPVASVVLYPFNYLNTHIHEMCHAIVGICTGGHVQDIKVFGDTSGVTQVLGGNVFMVLNAGYLGSTLVGGAVIALSGSEKSAQWVLRGLSLALAVSMALWVRGDLVGILSGLIWTLALFSVSMKRSPFGLFAAQFLGFQQCLNGFNMLRVVLFVSAKTNLETDASMLASRTLIPAVVWALLWCILGVIVVWWSLRIAWRRQDRVGRANPTPPTSS